jgi:hypothetical protein
MKTLIPQSVYGQSTNCVGGSFILSLHETLGGLPESTQLVDCSYAGLERG